MIHILKWLQPAYNCTIPPQDISADFLAPQKSIRMAGFVSKTARLPVLDPYAGKEAGQAEPSHHASQVGTAIFQVVWQGLNQDRAAVTE